MFRFALLYVLVVAAAVAAPAPGYFGGYAVPAATSYSSRIDIHGKPLVAAYAAPLVTKTVVAPVSYSLVGHEGYGLDGVPAVAGYGLGHGYGLDYGHGYEGYGQSYGLGW